MARTLAKNCDRLLLRLGTRLQQLLLGHAAIAPQRLKLAAIDARAFFGETLRDYAGKRQIDIIAAQQDMLADGDAVERQLAVAFGDGDEREIGGAAADIDDQDEVAHLHALAPIGVPLDPRVERGLRLFEQGDIAISGLFGGFERQLARHRVEGCGHGYEYLLIHERRVRNLFVPRVAQMLQVAAAGLHGRDLGDAFGRAEREQRRGAVHAGMREPRFGGRYHPAYIFDAALLRQAANHCRRIRIPRKSSRSGGKIAGAGQVEERGQQRLIADLAGVHELRNGEQLHVGGREGVRVRADFRISERGVGGAQVDSDDVLGWFHRWSNGSTQFRFPRAR
jgi:hypothetical protein